MNISAATFSSLHIFSTEHHPLNVAKGGQGHSKEGFSLFSLLDRTKSKGGRQILRQWMLKPLMDLEAITARQDFVELCMHPNLQTPIGTLLNLLEKVGPIDKILMRMQKCSTQPSDFFVLTKSLAACYAIYNTLINDILPRLEHPSPEEDSSAHDQNQPLLRGILQRCNVQALLDLKEQITDIVDEEATHDSKSVVIREGFDEKLDDWKEQYEYLEGKNACIRSSFLVKVSLIQTSFKQYLTRFCVALHYLKIRWNKLGQRFTNATPNLTIFRLFSYHR